MISNALGFLAVIACFTNRQKKTKVPALLDDLRGAILVPGRAGGLYAC